MRRRCEMCTFEINELNGPHSCPTHPGAAFLTVFAQPPPGKNAAGRIAELFGGAGAGLASRDGWTLQELCLAEGVKWPEDERQRLTFADGSAIVIQAGGWDLAIPGSSYRCLCFASNEGGEHDFHCKELIETIEDLAAEHFRLLEGGLAGAVTRILAAHGPHVAGRGLPKLARDVMDRACGLDGSAMELPAGICQDAVEAQVHRMAQGAAEKADRALAERPAAPPA